MLKSLINKAYFLKIFEIIPTHSYFKKVLFYLFVLHLTIKFSHSQNLIVDHGFEYPPYSSKWLFQAGSIVNLLNPFDPFSCNLMRFTTKNIFGTQLPRSGNSYFIFNLGGPNYMYYPFFYEYLCSQNVLCGFLSSRTKEKLKKNNVYKFNMFYSLPEGCQYVSNQGPSLFFTNDSTKVIEPFNLAYFWYDRYIEESEYYDYLNKYPNHLLWDTTTFISEDTQNWQEYSRCFKSKSDDEFMMIHWWGISSKYRVRWVYSNANYSLTACPGFNFPAIVLYLDDLSLTDEGYYGEDVRCRPDTSVCPGSSVVLQTNHEWNSAASYEWFPSTGLDCSTCPVPVASPSVTTTYRVKKTLCNYVTTDSVTVYVKNVPLPLANTSHTLCPGDTLKMNISEQIQPYVQIGWMPDAYATCSDCPAPAFFPPHSMQYTLNLSACNQTMTSVLNIQTLPENECADEEELYFFPELISPNADGKNDELQVKIGKAINGKLEIYNRWGNLIFQTEKMKFTTEANILSWDATYDGRKVPSGTYYYLVKWVNRKGEEHTRKSFLHVLY